MPLNLIILGLFPGICFSVFYLKGIRELARSDNIKLLSYHTFFAAIFITLFLIFTLFLSWLMNASLKVSSYVQPLSFEIMYICLLGLYLSSFYFAYRLGNYLCKKEFLYADIKPESHWNKIFSKGDDNFDLFYTSLVVEIGGKTWLYVGVLKDYLTNNGELEYIEIRKPYRREINDKTEDPTQKKEKFTARFYKIDVDFLIIKYPEIKSIGIKKVQIPNELL